MPLYPGFPYYQRQTEGSTSEERWSYTPKVAGSNPVGRATSIRTIAVSTSLYPGPELSGRKSSSVGVLS